MKSVLNLLALQAICLISTLPVCAQTHENFNSRYEANAPHVQQYLESHCWQFSNFVITTTGSLEGDASLVSTSGLATPGLYTPVLNVQGTLAISFKYSFAANASDSRSVNIYLTNATNEVVSLADNIDVTNAAANAVYNYNKSISVSPGIYKMYISYQGSADLPAVTIDNLSFSATQRYPNGCNQSPLATSDIITGNSNRLASGNVMANDTDPDGETLSAYLINDSKDGHISLSENGYFTFTPNPGFTGYVTAFTYQVCDQGHNQLCSRETTVTLRFPAVADAVADLQATYENNMVTLKWTMAPATEVVSFEIERSTDCENFENAGSVKNSLHPGVEQAFLFEDRVSAAFTKKNDLYYRLKENNKDGSTTYSKVLLVRVFKTKVLQSVSVTPNPTVNDIRVHLQLNEAAYVVIKVSSVNGEEMIRRSVKGVKGENSLRVEGSEKLKKGIYLLEVIVNSNERMVVKLIKN